MQTLGSFHEDEVPSSDDGALVDSLVLVHPSKLCHDGIPRDVASHEVNHEVGLIITQIGTAPKPAPP